CPHGLIQDGDELVVFRGIDPDDFADKDYDLYRDDARELVHSIQEKCVEYDPERKLSIIVEYIACKVTWTIHRHIALYRPDSLIVGTHGQRSVVSAWAARLGLCVLANNIECCCA
ncbi:uncharacterized protein BXZ73DRAFT_48138, partial [Epithele typhae]|uniref:uncharacterized protein n=1 Tax=Epithele typhae TaxID=378194 RepID=UPI0020089601